MPLVAKAELLRLSQADSSLTPLTQNLIEELTGICQPDWVATADLSETCAVITALHTYRPEALTAPCLAAFLKRLIASETAPGGPYADGQGRVSPLLNAFVVSATAQLASPMPNALAAAEAIPGIADVNAEDYGLYAWLASSERPRHSMSALHAVLAEHTISADTPKVVPLANKIYQRCLQRLRQLPEPLRRCSLEALEATMGTDHHNEISLLAYYAAGDNQRPEDSVTCGVANVMAWIAYTIYDDFLDDEGSPRLLSSGHQALQAMQQHYASLGLGDSFETFVASAMTTVDNANTRETLSHRFNVTDTTVTLGRLPDFGGLEMLADRALFHIIGPMALYAKQGVQIDDRLWKTKLTGFRHYLIAKQLNDDIHDWQKDFSAGHVTYVVAEIIRHFGLSPGVYIKADLLPSMQQAFWQEVLPPICDLATVNAEASLATLQPTPDGDLYNFIGRLKEEMLAAKRKIEDNKALARLFSESAS